MNAQEREQLLEELKDMKFRRAKNKLNRLDRNGRLAYYRNAQLSGQLHSHWVMDGLGINVTLVEAINPTEKPGLTGNRKKAEFELVEVILETQPENRT
jgi:hypothetical protein